MQAFSRLQSCALPHPSDWLQVVLLKPWVSASRLRNSDVLCSTAWKAPFIPATPVTPQSERANDVEGHHAVGCGYEDRIARHNRLRDAISTTSKAALLDPKELFNLIPESISKPADVYLLLCKNVNSQRPSISL